MRSLQEQVAALTAENAAMREWAARVGHNGGGGGGRPALLPAGGGRHFGGGGSGFGCGSPALPPLRALLGPAPAPSRLPPSRHQAHLPPPSAVVSLGHDPGLSPQASVGCVGGLAAGGRPAWGGGGRAAASRPQGGGYCGASAVGDFRPPGHMH